MAEETNTTVTENNQTAENSENAVSTNEGAEKTFTQSELDAIVKSRLERAAKNQPSKEDLKAFHDWQNSQKTAEQLAAEKTAAAEADLNDARKKLAAAEAKNTAFSKGVNAEAIDDVIALAMSKVNDDVDINAAIDAVIKKYPSFCGGCAKGITTGVSFGGSSNMTDGVTAAFLKRNPNIKI